MNYFNKYLTYKKKYMSLKNQIGGKKKRPSPSESATKFELGTKKKGNDGNMWIIVKNKNGVKRWKKHEIKRPSPSESATEFELGTEKKGNDGNMWIVIKNKNGVKRWKKKSQFTDKDFDDLCLSYASDNLDKPEFCWMKSKYKYDFEFDNHFDVEIKEMKNFKYKIVIKIKNTIHPEYISFEWIYVVPYFDDKEFNNDEDLVNSLLDVIEYKRKGKRKLRRNQIWDRAEYILDNFMFADKIYISAEIHPDSKKNPDLLNMQFTKIIDL